MEEDFGGLDAVGGGGFGGGGIGVLRGKNDKFLYTLRVLRTDEYEWSDRG
jgi:hypothetical protein